MQVLRAPSTAAQASAPPSAPSSSNVAVPATARGGPKKILSDGMEFTPDEVSSLLSETVDFTVIGVIGSQGTGKSTILSLLAGARWADTWQLQDPLFAPQSDSVVMQAGHQTSGIDLHVTPERLILLDTQPLFSPSVLLELQKREASLPPDVQTHENLFELYSLRVAMLLLSSCHVVICTQDARCDPLALRTLRTAHMLRHRMPDLSVLAQLGPQSAAAAISAAASALNADESPPAIVEYTPHFAFVFSRMPPDAFDAHRQSTLRAMLQRLFVASASTETTTLASEQTDGDAAADRGGATVTDGGDATPMEVYCLPAVGVSGGQRLCASHLGYRAEAERCRDELLSIQRRPFARPITEKEWLRGFGRMWDMIRRNAMLADFNRCVQKLHHYA